MQKLFIAGAGGFAREIAWQVNDNCANPTADPDHRFELIGFVIGKKPVTDKMAKGDVEVLGNDEWALENLDSNIPYLCAVGHSPIRRKVSGYYRKNGFEAATFIHDSVNIAGPVSIGEGSMVCMGTTLTGNISLGKHCVVNLNCTIGHDCEIGDFVTLNPGVHLSGSVKIADGVEIGSGAVVLPGMSIGEGAVIGAGAVVRTDVPAGEVWVGVPANKKF